MASTVVTNAKIWTEDGLKSWMAFDDGKITAVGNGDPPSSGKIIDLHGNGVLPGLHDSHIHVYSLGRMSTRLRLHGTGSITEMQAKLEEFAESSDRDWIIGHGWDQDLMEDGRYPSKHDLDRMVHDRPVLLYRACNHIGVVNSKALEIMGIDGKTEDPEGGRIDREPNGEPSGILREEGLSLVAPHISYLDEKHRLEYYKEGVRTCLEKGLTAVHTNDALAWEYYKRLDDDGELPIRVYLTLKYSDLDKENYLPKFGERHGLLTCRRVKLFADGSLGAETAGLRENYQGSDHSGILIDKPEVLASKIQRIHESGYQLEVHAIGDFAAEITMDGFEKIGIGKSDRPIITHCQILAKDLVERMAENGYIANIQPPFVPTDARWAEKRLGDGERLDYAYAWKYLLDAGVIAAGGSDAPIEDADPFWGMYCAMEHPRPDGTTWKEEQKLSFEEALGIYSTHGAYAVGEEERMGELSPGKVADFVVIDPLVFTDHTMLRKQPVRQVWVNGQREL